jgi:hypothetical protein
LYLRLQVRWRIDLQRSIYRPALYLRGQRNPLGPLRQLILERG